MYKFIKFLPHSNITYSHVAYLYQDMSTKKYYLSHTHPDSENVIDNSSQFMLINNKPKTFTPEFLHNISKEAEVTSKHFASKNINGYLL